MWSEIIDFKYFPYAYAEFGSNTQEYAALNELDQEEWDEYLLDMSTKNSGIDIRYDNVDDIFVVECAQGHGKYFGTPISTRDEESSDYQEEEIDENPGKYFDTPMHMDEGKKSIKEGAYSDYETEEVNKKGEVVKVQWEEGETEAIDGRVRQCWAIGTGSDGSKWSATVDVCTGEWGDLEDIEEITPDESIIKEGDMVTIEFEPGVTSEGVVENVHSDGTLDVTWEDGSRNENLDPSDVETIKFNESEDKGEKSIISEEKDVSIGQRWNAFNKEERMNLLTALNLDKSLANKEWSDITGGDNQRLAKELSNDIYESEEKEEGKDEKQLLLGDKDKDTDELIEAIINEPLEDIEPKVASTSKPKKSNIEGEEFPEAEIEFDSIVKDTKESQQKGPEFDKTGISKTEKTPKSNILGKSPKVNKTVEIVIDSNKEMIKTESINNLADETEAKMSLSFQPEVGEKVKKTLTDNNITNYNIKPMQGLVYFTFKDKDSLNKAIQILQKTVTENKMSEKKQIKEADDDKRISSAFQTLALAKKALEEASTQLILNLGYHFQKLYESDLTELNNTIEIGRKQIETLSKKIRTQLKR